MGAAVSGRRHLGMVEGELAGKPYAKYWRPDMRLVRPNGDVRVEGGVLHVDLATPMPGVSPAMIDWWFGWHSDEPQRYKLWHPRAHVHATWKQPPPRGAAGRDAYVGRTSVVDEYIGDRLGRYDIRFVVPADVGSDPAAFANADVATAVCARVALAGIPVEGGYLAHEVRRVAGGAEMRSRFRLGGDEARARRGGLLGDALVAVLRRVQRPDERLGRALLDHCAQEMAHLATFLPALYDETAGDADAP